MTSELSRLAADLLPLANVLRALNTVRDMLPPAQKGDVTKATDALAAEAVRVLTAYTGGAVAGEHLADDLVYLVFHRGKATLCGGLGPLLDELVLAGLREYGSAVSRWVDSARTGDIGSFMPDDHGKVGFNVMVFRERWMAAG